MCGNVDVAWERWNLVLVSSSTLARISLLPSITVVFMVLIDAVSEVNSSYNGQSRGSEGEG